MNPKLPNLVLEHFSLPSVLFIYEKQLKTSFQKKKKDTDPKASPPRTKRKWI